MRPSKERSIGKAKEKETRTLDRSEKQEQINLDFYSMANAKQNDSISGIASIFIEIITLFIARIEIG
jgi:hypothetical protein